jgi:uncharacterized protein
MNALFCRNFPVAGQLPCFLRVATWIGFLVTISGCSLPQAQPDPTRFYLLSTETAPSAPPSTAVIPTLHIREIELASYLRSRPLIIRRGENEIEFREFALWGEPLELGVARVLREDLLARGAARAVVLSSARKEQGNGDLNLSVRVLACEGAANGEVVFRAVWEVASTGAGSTMVARGDYRAADLRWDGKSEASLAAQLSQAIAGLADEVAAALQK